MVILEHHHRSDNVAQDGYEYDDQKEQRVEYTTPVSRHIYLLLRNCVSAIAYTLTESLFVSTQCLSLLSKYIRVREDHVVFARLQRILDLASAFEYELDVGRIGNAVDVVEYIAIYDDDVGQLAFRQRS